MDRIFKRDESCGGVKIGDCTVQRLLFANHLVLLDSTQNGLQQTLDKFSDACSVTVIKISSKKQKPCAYPDNQGSAFSKLVKYY